MTIPVHLPANLMPNVAAPGAALEAALVQTLEGGRAALPMLPTIATQAMQLANDPDSSPLQFAELVRSDPPIAARFLATANSSYYSRGQQIVAVDEAVSRLGVTGARDLIFQVAYSSTTAGLKRYQKQVQQSFERSVLCATICRLAVPTLKLSVSDGYLCGLLHDIGEARVFRILSEKKGACKPEEAVALVEKYHPRAGMELAERWALPDEIVQVCRRHHERGTPPNDQVLVVRLADALVPVVVAGAAGQPADISEVDPELLEELGVRKPLAEKVLHRVLNQLAAAAP